MIDTNIDFIIEGDTIDLVTEFGQTVTEIVSPETYTGQTTVTPSTTQQILQTKNKLVTENVTVESAPLGVLNVDPLTTEGSVFPVGDIIGFSQVTVEEDWDEILYPIPDDPDNVFNAKHVNVKTGDKIIVEGVGMGRWFGFRNATTDIPASVRVTLRTGYYDYMRFKYDVDCDCILVLAGYNSSQDGAHSTNSAYQFRGEYLKYKVIHAS